MAEKADTPTCCLTLPLVLEKWQEDRLTKRLEIGRVAYNTLLHVELKKLDAIKRKPEYQQIMQDGQNASTEKEKQAQRNKVYAFIKQYLRSSTFDRDMKPIYKHYLNEKKKPVSIGSSVAVNCISKQVWAAFDKMLKEGTKVHFKKKGEMDSLRGAARSGQSGGVEIIYRESYIEWNGLKLRLKQSPSNAYEAEMLSRRVKYVRILRRAGKTKAHWYAQLSLEGIPAVKYHQNTGVLKHPVGHGVVGLDLGTRTLAYSAAGEANLIELADRVQNIEREKCLLQRKMDRSRRATNPDNYKADGTIKRGVKLTHHKSKRYQRIQSKLAYIQHRQAEIRKLQHTELANHLLTLGDTFYIEKMDYRNFAKRAKTTEISEKTGRFKRKKRFGKSIANKAPKTFVDILQRKCTSLGLPGVIEVDTRIKASQYNHQTDTCTPKELNERWNDMPDGECIQRDLYSAFLLQHCQSGLAGYDYKTLQTIFGSAVEKIYDREAIQKDYPQFLQYHHQTIQRLRQLKNTPSSMGIRRILG